MSNIQRWGTYTPEAADSDADLASSLSGSNIMDLVVGDNVVRFLPPPVGQSSPFRITSMHYIDAVPGLDKMVVFACPRAERKQPCVACAEAERLNKTGNPLDRERAFRISGSLRLFANVLDRKTGQVRVLAFGKQIQTQLKELRKNSRKGGDFTDPTERGFDIIITREGTGQKDTRYTVAADRANSPLAATEDEIVALIESSHDLEALVNPMEPEELLRVWGENNIRAPNLPAGRAPASAATLPRGPQDVRQIAPPAGPRVGASMMARSAAAPAPARPAPTPAFAPTPVVGAQVESDDDFPPSYNR